MRHITFECSAHEANRFKNLKEGTMQKKIIAAAVIAMMMIAGVAMVSDDSDANAPVSGTTTVYAGDTVGENILLKYNESAYDHYEIGVTIKVQAFTSEQDSITYPNGTDLVTATGNTITDSNNLTYKLSQPAGTDDKYEGNYWLNITAAPEATATDYYLYVQYQVTLKIDGTSILVNPVTSCFKITVSAPETVEITAVDGYSLVGTAGENFTSQLKVLKDGSAFTNPIVWYADLPDGLAITPSGDEAGKITGIPKEATKGGDGSVAAQSFKVYVTDTVTGVVYMDEISITINESTGEADGNLAIKVSGMSNNNQPVNNCYYVEQGTGNVKFSVTATNAVITAVKVVNDGTVTPVVPTNGSVTDKALNTDGTGRYMIYAEGISNNGQYISIYVFVEVYAQTLDVTAEIIGSSS